MDFVGTILDVFREDRTSSFPTRRPESGRYPRQEISVSRGYLLTSPTRAINTNPFYRRNDVQGKGHQKRNEKGAGYDLERKKRGEEIKESRKVNLFP
jgi:hypothetical protein